MKTEPTICTGIEVRPTEDGPEVMACLCEQCVGRRRFRDRSDVQAGGFTNAMVAAIPDDEAF